MQHLVWPHASNVHVTPIKPHPSNTSPNANLQNDWQAQFSDLHNFVPWPFCCLYLLATDHSLYLISIPVIQTALYADENTQQTSLLSLMSETTHSCFCRQKSMNQLNKRKNSKNSRFWFIDHPVTFKQSLKSHLQQISQLLHFPLHIIEQAQYVYISYTQTVASGIQIVVDQMMQVCRVCFLWIVERVCIECMECKVVNV